MEILTLPKLGQIYGDHINRKLSTVSTRAANDGKLFKLINEGKAGCTVKRVNHILAWFDENWPADLEWPADIDRPSTPKKIQRRGGLGVAPFPLNPTSKGHLMHPDISPIAGRFAESVPTDVLALRAQLDALPEQQQLALATRMICSATDVESVQQLRRAVSAGTLAADDLERAKSVQDATGRPCTQIDTTSLLTTHPRWAE